MESWQEDLIKRNRDRLIKNTVCSTLFLNIFLSKGIFSTEDVEKIAVEEKNCGNHQAAGKFYNAIVTRTNAFNVLLAALHETKQSGSYDILDQSHDNQAPSDSSSRNKHLTEINSLDTETATEIPIRINNPIFKDTPAYLKEFIANHRKTLLIIFSEDCQITCKRLMDRCMIFYDVREFAEYISTTGPSPTQIPVLNCNENLEECIALTCGIETKHVFVASKFEFANCNVDGDAMNKNHNKSHLTFVNDNITWDDLTTHFRLQLCTQLESDPRINLSGNDISNALQNSIYSTFVELINKKSPTLFQSSIPPPIPYYIPRSLLSRNVVGRQLFTTSLDNIFLFQGISMKTLRSLSNIKDVTNSTTVIQQGYQLLSRFIALDQDDHIARICKNIQKNSFHLLHFDGNDFIWKNTCGNIEIIQQCISTNQPSTTENSFIKDILEGKSPFRLPICISDTPGMGKTVFLANVARKLQQKIQNGLVGYVVISELIRDIKDTMDKLHYKQISGEMVVNKITQLLSSNSIGEVYLRRKRGYIKELLLDGFDEIDNENENLGYSFLINLRLVFPDARLWVTTRPHKLHKLEQVLQVLGFNMLPFCENDQISCLSTFWENGSIPSPNLNKLPIFASHCLVNIKSTLDAKEQDIAGIPLQCLMIAEVFEDEAIAFCNSSDTLIIPKLAIHHTIQLYEELANKKIKIFFSRYDTATSPAPELSLVSRFLENILPKSIIQLFYDPAMGQLTPQDLINIHMYQSVCLLYPNIAIKLYRIIVSRNLSVKLLIDCGLMELKNTPFPSFLHRTIAEYFLAILFVDSLFNGKYNKYLRSLMFKEIFKVQETGIRLPGQTKIICYEFQHYVVCYFIDALCGSNPPSSKLGFELLTNESISNKREIATACAAGNFQNIFSLLFTQKGELEKITHAEFILDLICISVFRGCLLMLNVCKNLTIIKLADLNMQIYHRYTLLHFAVAGGDFLMVTHLCEKENFASKIVKQYSCFKDLIPFCVINTKLLNRKLLAERIQIINYVLNISNNLIICGPVFNNSSISWKTIHVTLVNEISSKICEDETTSQHFFYDLTKVEANLFLEICRAVFPAEKNLKLCSLLTSKSAKPTLLQSIVKNMRPNLNIFHFILSFDFGTLSLGILQIAIEENKHEWANWILINSKASVLEITASLQFLCLHHKNFLRLFKNLDPKVKSTEGNNLLHTILMDSVSSTLNNSIVNFLLRKGFDPGALNNYEWTPLHVLAKRCNIFDFGYMYKDLIEFGADINAQNAEGDTPFHILLRSHTSKQILEYFTPNVLSILLKSGANVNIENYKNETPMLLVVKRLSWCSIIKILIAEGNPNYQKKFNNGSTYLHLLLSTTYNIEESKESKMKYDLFKFIIVYFKSINRFSPLKIANDDGKTFIDIGIELFGRSEVNHALQTN